MSEPIINRLFLGAGAMKAGTTWLYDLLNRHPQIYFTPEKELHYFYARHVRSDILSDQSRLENVQRKYLKFDPARARPLAIRDRMRWIANYLDGPVDDHWYRSLFLHRPSGAWACDFSNLYALLPEPAWVRIAERVVDLRVVYTMRDPIDRLWSHAKFHLKVTGQADAIDRWSAAQLEAFVRRPFIWENAEYGAAVRRMKGALPDGTLRLMFHENIHADEAAALAGIEAFLDLPPFAYPENAVARRINATEARPIPEEFRARLLPDAQRIAGELKALGLEVPASWCLEEEAAV